MRSAKLVRSTLGILISLCLVAAIGAQTRKEREQAKRLQDDGDKAFVQKDFQTAVQKYGQAIQIIPANSYAHYKKGFAHYNLKENPAALNEFAIALSQGFRPLE